MATSLTGLSLHGVLKRAVTAGFVGERATTVARLGTRRLGLGCLGLVRARLHDLGAAVQSWCTPAGVGLGVALVGRRGPGVTAAAVTRLAEPHRRAWFRRGVGVLSPGLARRMDGAIDLLLA